MHLVQGFLAQQSWIHSGPAKNYADYIELKKERIPEGLWQEAEVVAMDYLRTHELKRVIVANAEYIMNGRSYSLIAINGVSTVCRVFLNGPERKTMKDMKRIKNVSSHKEIPNI